MRGTGVTEAGVPCRPIIRTAFSSELDGAEQQDPAFVLKGSFWLPY